MNKFGDIRPVGDTFVEIPKTPPIKYHNNLFEDTNRGALQYLIEDRKLTLETIKNFMVGVDERGDIAIPITKDGNIVNYKFRGVKEKTFRQFERAETWVLNDTALKDCVEAGYLIITEGEYDAMAVWQMGFRAVISGTGGVNGKTPWVADIPDELKSIYICGDNDVPGQEYAKKLADKLGLERCYNIILPTKDANDFIKAGYGRKEFIEYLKPDKAKRFDIPGVSKVVDAIEELRKNPTQRYPTHLNRFNIHTKGGIIKNGLVTITAKPGVGKSSLLLNFLIHHADNGIPVLLVSLENDMMLTLQRIIETKYKTTRDKLTDDDWITIKNELSQYPFYVDTSKTINTPYKLRKVINQAKKLWGVEVVGYDHVGMITSKKDELPEIAREMSELRNENAVTLYLISHVRKGERDQKAITGDDIYGTSAFNQLSNVVLLLQNFGKGMELTIEKSRESQSHLRIPIIFNGETGEVLDDTSRKVKFFDQELEDDQKTTPFVVPTNIEPEPHKPEGLKEELNLPY